MKWNVSHLLKSSIGTERQYCLDDDGWHIPELVSGITGSARLIRTDRGILVLAQGKSAVLCPCSRCLEESQQPVSFDIAEEFFPTVDVQDGSRLEKDWDDQAFTIDASHVLDLGKVVLQYALLDVPMKPLCAQDCPGICATCGAALRSGPCGCSAGQPDPRWTKLESLRLGLGSAS
ncbi:MAG: DUF177 domain-containing protein [Dehalococcoidia bacterium]